MKIAVVGTGIAGLGAAYVLSRAHSVELFERNGYAGGHTNTVSVERNGSELALDTGFIVHNERNYPNLARLFRELGVATQESDMSFSVRCRGCGLEYSSRSLLAQPRRAFDPRFRRLVADILRFLQTARSAIEGQAYEGATLGEYLAAERYSRTFVEHYAVPLTAAIWSTAPEQALGTPATFAIQFFDNHAMLGFRRHPWKTVTGGSRAYVHAILARMNGPVHLACPVTSVARDPNGVEIHTADGRSRRFDRVVIAAHAGESLALLTDPSEDERRILGAFQTTTNDTVLHTDDRFLPRTPAARASWNYLLDDCRPTSTRPTMTYYLNRLQRLEEPEEYCVTLNRSSDIRDESVIERLTYEHPLYTLESANAQRELPQLSGVRNTAFCGAYHGFGFHEDGLVSGVRAAHALGATW